jgi:hypothetical protein
MAQVIENLLIGVGLQTDQKSFQNAEGSLDGLKSKALQVGAVLAGAFGADALTFGFAEKTDELGKFSDRWGLAANDVSAYDKALQEAGGSQGEFLSTVKGLAKAVSMLDIEKAKFLPGMFQLGIGDQVSEVLNAGNALDAFLVSADQLATLSGSGKEKFIDAMGFSQSDVLLLNQGRDAIVKAVEKFKTVAPVTKTMTDTAAKFNDEWLLLTSNAGGFSDRVAEPLTASIANIIVGMNDWISKNRDVINSLLEFGGGAVANNIGTITTALALFSGAKILGGVGAVASKLGLISSNATMATGKIAGLAKGFGVLGAALVAESLVSDYVNENVGDGGVADFLANNLSDQAIGGLFSSASSAITQNAPTTQSTSYGTQRPLSDSVSLSDSVVSRSEAAQQSAINQQQAQQQRTNQTIKVEVMLDGAPVKAITKQFLEEANEQAIQDTATSNGG